MPRRFLVFTGMRLRTGVHSVFAETCKRHGEAAAVQRKGLVELCDI